MVVVIQRYFAKRGMAERVIATREEASGRLRQMGLPDGITLVPSNETQAAPDAVWICAYSDLPEREEFRSRAESDAVFSAIRTRQSQQLERFERDVLDAVRDTEVIVP